MKRLPSLLKFGGIVLLFVMGIVLRGIALPAISGDVQWAYIPWYDILKTHGMQAIGTNFSDYTPPYLYLLWLATLTSNFLPSLVAVKLITIFADIVNTVLVYRIVKLKYPTGLKPILASALFWILPTVMINSSLWGQTDSLYSLFLLACIYFLLIEKSSLCLVTFGIAFAFKAQAIFILPFLAILFLKKIIAWQSILLPPLTYIMLSIPPILFGRPWSDVLSIYLLQASTFQSLSSNAPNLYIFMSTVPYKYGTIIGLIFAILIVGSWIWLNARARLDINHKSMILMSLVSVALVPLVLPKMHDRYFYPADIFSLLTAFYISELWFAPILYQIISMSAYLVTISGAPILLLQIAAVLNVIIAGFLVWEQVRLCDIDNRKKNTTSIAARNERRMS